MGSGRRATQDVGEPGNGIAPASGAWAALGVRPNEVDRVRKLFVAAMLVGFALVFFFSGSNGLFLDEVGADVLPWVYIANAPLVIAAGLAYSAWSRRASTARVLRSSIWVLAMTVTVLWVLALTTTGPVVPFALAVWFRFLFIFGLLGLWEITSAVFDVRQSKRLVPAVALGTMVAFMIGGFLVSGLTALIGTVHLIAISAACFVLYGVAFARALEGADFGAADAANPATPSDIVADRFSRNLAGMRCITILLVFVTEFIFFDQVERNFGGDDTIARFLGVFMAVSTLLMVIFTAVASSRYIARFGLKVGLASMPAGLALAAVVMGVWAALFGVGTGFFVLAVVTNLLNIILSNAIETPAGAVMYQPMPAERRMPVRVAVDGWLGSVALLAAGVLLLAFDALAFDTVVPFVWLLAGIAAAGVVLAWRVYQDYLDALDAATQLAFSGSGAADGIFGESSDLRSALFGGLAGEDPASAFALASFLPNTDAPPLTAALPRLVHSDDVEVAILALDAIGQTGDTEQGRVLADIVANTSRPEAVRSAALRNLYRLDAPLAHQTAYGVPAGSRGEFGARVRAIVLADDGTGETARQLSVWAESDAADRRFVAQVLADLPGNGVLTPELESTLTHLINDTDPDTRQLAMRAAQHRLSPALIRTLIQAGANPQDRRHAVTALATGGAEVVEIIETSDVDLPDAYAIDLIDDVYATKTRRPTLLHRFLEPDSPSAIRRAGFDAARQADVSLPATVLRMLRDDVDYANQLIAAWSSIAESRVYDEVPLVGAALADEFAATQAAIWAGLRLTGDPKRLAEIEHLARTTTGDGRANAIEVLDTLLPHQTRSLVLPVLEAAGITEAADATAPANPEATVDEALTALDASPRLSQITRRLIHHYLGSESMSESIERVLALKRVDIFATLPLEILAELATVAQVREVDRHETIITEGDFGDELFAISHGAVVVEREGSRTELSAGTVFGELAVLDPGPRSATVTASEPCELLVVARPMLLTLTDQRPEVMAEIARVLAVRLRQA